MPRLAANLSLMFTEVPFMERFEAAAKAGFQGVEFLFPYAWPKHDIAARLNENGLQQVLFNISPGNWDAGDRGLAAIKGREAEFEAAVIDALRYADALGCVRLHAMSGLTERGANLETLIGNVANAARLAQSHGVEILIEPINTFDMPGYFLTTVKQARDVIKAVGHDNVGLQFDCYHRQRMEGGVAEAIAENVDITRHYQIASPPDRGEPDSGELDFVELLAAIDSTGYGGWVGCEYRPRGDTLAGLSWVKTLGLELG